MFELEDFLLEKGLSRPPILTVEMTKTVRNLAYNEAVRDAEMKKKLELDGDMRIRQLKLEGEMRRKKLELEEAL